MTVGDLEIFGRRSDGRTLQEVLIQAHALARGNEPLRATLVFQGMIWFMMVDPDRNGKQDGLCWHTPFCRFIVGKSSMLPTEN